MFFLPDKNPGSLRSAIIAQIGGNLGWQAFNGGIMLTYFSSRGLSSPVIMFLLAIPMLMNILLIFFAFLGDRNGMKRVGGIGTIVSMVGFLFIFVSSYVERLYFILAVIVGTVLFSFGNMLFASVWFGLMHPLIPDWFRGRFWGLLRFCWQLVAIIFFLISSYFLKLNFNKNIFGILLGMVCVGLLLRVLFFRVIIEKKEKNSSETKLSLSLKPLVLNPGFLGFCIYVFLIYLFTGACPALFGLIEKEVLHLENFWVIIFGASIMAGQLIGFLFIGTLIDLLGTKQIFIVSHLLFALIMFLFIMHNAIISYALLFVWLGFFNFLFGLTFASMSISITTEMMYIIPDKNKSLSTSMVTTAIHVGGGIAGALSSVLIATGMLASRWSLFKLDLSNYDSILLLNEILIIILVISIWLIPSMRGAYHIGNKKI